jgi:hypothetical protein
MIRFNLRGSMGRRASSRFLFIVIAVLLVTEWLQLVGRIALVDARKAILGGTAGMSAPSLRLPRGSLLSRVMRLMPPIDQDPAEGGGPRVSFGSELRPGRAGARTGRRTGRTRAQVKSISSAISGAGGGAAALHRLH